jgi:hypothetical protein
MLASHLVTASHLPTQIQILIVLLGIAGVIFWRLALRIIVILVVILLVFGAIAFLEGFVHGIG